MISLGFVDQVILSNSAEEGLTQSCWVRQGPLFFFICFTNNNAHEGLVYSNSTLHLIKYIKTMDWFWSKIGHFFIFFFLGNIGKKNVFDDILERKNAFLGYKSKKCRESKKLRFLQTG